MGRSTGAVEATGAVERDSDLDAEGWLLSLIEEMELIR